MLGNSRDRVNQQELRQRQQAQAAYLPQQEAMSEGILWVIAAAVPVASKPVATTAAKAPAVTSVVAAALSAAC